MRAPDRDKLAAFRHVIGSINNVARLPAQVFRGTWGAFLFFQSDNLVSPRFAATAAGLLNVERAGVCCLLNFSETHELAYESAALQFIDARTSPQEYDKMLRRGGPAEGWLFSMGRYGCASDRGGWSIYSESMNDVAVIAIRHSTEIERYRECLAELEAEPIEVLLSAGAAAPLPFDKLVEPWRHDLARHYGDHGT